MKYCESCKVKLEGGQTRCPLCHNPVREIGGEEYRAFPAIPQLNPQKNFLYRLLQFLTIVVATVAVSLNVVLHGTGWWSLFILAGLASGWVCLFVFIRKRHNPLKALCWQATLGILIAVLWDVGTGWHGWSINFVVPVLLLTAMATALVLGLALRIPTAESFIFICWINVLGLVPLIFILTGILKFIYLSLACVAASVIYFAALFTLEGAPFRSELRRRFHL
ncbi:MAG: DUF6320 domain-containing protein [Pygmaiobacter sp.]